MFVELRCFANLSPKDCLRARKLIAFAIKPSGKFWSSADAFVKAAKKEFSWFGKIQDSPDWSAIIAQVMAAIQQIMDQKS
jgi:hypothetical protein